LKLKKYTGNVISTIALKENNNNVWEPVGEEDLLDWL
tara:strand:+ start:226 stop:336 length:111 start_codon:yes stop_codon:yes gene_type:complete